MRFSNSHLKIRTAAVLLATLAWPASGADLWAAARSLRDEPEAVLARLAHDPRVPLRPAERAAVERLVAEMKTARPAANAPKASERGAEAAPEVSPEAMKPTPQDPPVEHGTEVAAALRALAGAPAAVDADRRLEALAEQVERTDAETVASFTRTEEMLHRAGLPEAALSRHRAAVARYREGMGVVRANLATAAAAGPERARALLDAAAGLERRGARGEARPLDPARLPVRAPRPAPERTEEAARLGATAALAGAADLRTAAPGAADLAETEEVRSTPEIRALATSLGNDPRRIYEWVRNSIEVVPTAAAWQDAARTLEARRGNAVDTASLLLALLRAAGIPSRYVAGTIELSPAAAQSWIGDAASLEQAARLARAGGLSATILTDPAAGGADVGLVVDHVWVEAFVDYVPGRGAQAIRGAGDTWIPLDPSFKGHRSTPRSGLFTDRPFAPSGADTAVVVDETLGRMSGFDDRALALALDAWLRDSITYLADHGTPATLEGIVGGRAIVAEERSILPASLPYRVLGTPQVFSELPEARRGKLVLKGYASALDRANGRTAFVRTLHFPALGTRRLALTFAPASALDQQILDAARAAGAPALPVYLVDVVPRLELDGEQLAVGAAVPMGSPFLVDASVVGPNGAEPADFLVTAGDEVVIGAHGNGVVRDNVFSRLAAHPIEDAGEFLNQVQLNYYAGIELLAAAGARVRGVELLQLPTVGFFSAPLEVETLFGAPYQATYRGHLMDVRLLLQAAIGATPADELAAHRQSGMIASYFEGQTFDTLLGRTADDPISSVSAMRLLAAAAHQNIPLYRVTTANLAAVLPRLSLPAPVVADVRHAVEQGQVAIVPEREVDLADWRGAGYVIEDPRTGSGAYLIAGGHAGGRALLCEPELVPEWVRAHIQAILALIAVILISAVITIPGVWPAVVETLQAAMEMLWMWRAFAGASLL